MHTTSSQQLAQSLADTTSPRGCADRIQAAIDRLAEGGGGTLSLPVGTWRVTTIQLRSGITLHLPFGCILEAHDNLADFAIGNASQSNKDRQPYHLLVAEGAEQVGITGDGIIDGRGPAFWDEPIMALAKRGIDINAYVDKHGLCENYRNPNHPWFREKKARVSPLVDFINCRGVILRGITIRNSPGWTVHLHNCDDVQIQFLTIRNDLFGPNTDGLDINGCRDVRISDCDLTCGDDAIILKSMDDARSCERIAVSNCIIASNCAALGIGAETVHAIRDVSFTGCVIRQALRAVQIEMWDAGLVENVVVNGLTGTTDADVPLQRAIYVDIQHHGRRDGALGTCRNLIFSDIALQTRGRCMLTAADGSCIEDVTLRDIQLTYPTIEDPARALAFQASSQMSNDCPHTRDKPAALVCDNVHRLLVSNMRVRWPGQGRGRDALAAAAAANTELNPYHGNIPMHAIWMRRVEGAIIDAPWLQANDPDGHHLERIIAEDCSNILMR
ncbi:MAG: hypothetical protein EA402_11130 [Planctomycetota bacterium]|nr:MAG: hypothetical protein EA402_11130 [Planctomycetota bacterium]